MAEAKTIRPGDETKQGEPRQQRQEDDRREQECTDAPLHRGGSLEHRDLPEKVDEASDESFPASDPPSYSPS